MASRITNATNTVVAGISNAAWRGAKKTPASNSLESWHTSGKRVPWLCIASPRQYRPCIWDGGMVSPWKPPEVRSYHVCKGFMNLNASNWKTEPQTSYVVFLLDKLKSDIITQSALLFSKLRNIMCVCVCVCIMLYLEKCNEICISMKSEGKNLVIMLLVCSYCRWWK